MNPPPLLLELLLPLFMDSPSVSGKHTVGAIGSKTYELP